MSKAKPTLREVVIHLCGGRHPIAVRRLAECLCEMAGDPPLVLRRTKTGALRRAYEDYLEQAATLLGLHG
jgi:hypothetical protein